MTIKEVIKDLEYIVNSPPREYGGFHPEAVRTAVEAVRYLREYKLTRRFQMSKENHEHEVTCTVQELINWLSNLEPTQEVRCWEHGEDVPFNPVKHIDHDRLHKRIVVDLG